MSLLRTGPSRVTEFVYTHNKALPSRRVTPAIFVVAFTALAMFTGEAAASSVRVLPSDDLQTIVNQYPASTTFSLAAGTYRLQSVVPKNGDSVVGQRGALLSGAALLTNFTSSGSYWTAQVEVTEASS